MTFLNNKTLIAILILISFLSCNLENQDKLNLVIEELETNTDISIRALHVIDENTIWASGTNGTVLLSKDGGITWEANQVEGAQENDFRSIYAWNRYTAIVFGVAGPDYGYQTFDGGKNWKVIYSDSTDGLFFNSINFANEYVGLAVSDPIDGKFFVLRTEHAGERWTRITNIPEVKNGEANFAASNTCIEFLPSGNAWIASGGINARVFYSNDFGRNWNVSNTPIIRGQASSGIFSIEFKNDKEGVIVGGIYDQPEINTNIAAYTTDGGKNWLPAAKMPQEYRSCVQTVLLENEIIYLAVGKTGIDFSRDGVNWNFIDSNGYYTFRAVPGKAEGFVAGANGRIAKVYFNKD